MANVFPRFERHQVKKVSKFEVKAFKTLDEAKIDRDGQLLWEKTDAAEFPKDWKPVMDGLKKIVEKNGKVEEWGVPTWQPAKKWTGNRLKRILNDRADKVKEDAIKLAKIKELSKKAQEKHWAEFQARKKRADKIEEK